MQQQNEQNSPELPVISATGAETTEQTQLSRRKFLTKVGVGSLPVIMSVKSGSAWGCINLECTPGQVNLSGTSSAIASARANPGGSSGSVGGNYTLPKWPKRQLLMEICAVDFDKYCLDINQPLKYNGKTITSATTIKTIFGGALGGCNSDWKVFEYTKKTQYPYIKSFTGENGKGTLNKSSLEGYFMSAFLGALWERHPAYKYHFETNGQQYCFPEPHLIVKAYKDACLKGTLAKAEMLQIFRAYTREGSL